MVTVGNPTITPLAQGVEIGDDVMFICEASGENLNFTWDSTAGVTLPNPVTDGNTSTLTLTADFSYSGEYVCVVSSDNGVLQSEPAILAVNGQSLSCGLRPVFLI